jgi:hypothetical protein
MGPTGRATIHLWSQLMPKPPGEAAAAAWVVTRAWHWVAVHACIYETQAVIHPPSSLKHIHRRWYTSHHRRGLGAHRRVRSFA